MERYPKARMGNSNSIWWRTLISKGMSVSGIVDLVAEVIGQSDLSILLTASY